MIVGQRRGVGDRDGSMWKVVVQEQEGGLFVRRTKRFLGRAFVAIVLMTIGLSCLSSVAYASWGIGMATPAGHHWVVQGAQVYATNYWPIVGSQGGVSTWAMICNADTAQVAQVGWLRAPFNPQFGDGLWYFWEYEPDPFNNPIGPQRIGAVPNPHDGQAQHKYCVWTPTGGGVKYQIDNKLMHTGSMSWTPNYCEWMSEIHDLERDYVPGAADGDCESLSHVQHLYSGTWINDNATGLQANSTTHGRGTWYWSPDGYGGCWYYDNRG